MSKESKNTPKRWQPNIALKEPLPVVMHRAREAFMEHVRPILRRYDLTEQQWRALRALYLEGDLDASNLADSAGLRKSSLTRVIRQLGNRKYLTRRRDKGDGRRVKLQLTKRGEKFCLELGPQMEKNHAETVALLDGVKLVSLVRELGKVIDALEQQSSNKDHKR